MAGRVVRVDRAAGTVDVLTGDGVLRCAGSRGTAASRSPPPSWSVRSAPPSGRAPPISSGGCASSGADSYFGRASPGSVTGVPLLVNPTLETTGVAPADPVSVSWYCR